MRHCRTGLLGRKLGSTQVFDPESGACFHVTVLQAGPCRVTQVKTRDRHGYCALQLGFEEVTKAKLKTVNRPRQGHFRSAGVAPMRVLKEVRLREDPTAAPGQTLTVDIFKDVKHVDVVGTTKGRGFSGGIRRWGFRGGPMSHGSKHLRRPGGTGGKGEVPTKVVKGKRMPGHFGNARRTVRNLEVVRVDPEHHVLVVRGAVPGPRHGLLIVSDSVRG